MVDRFGALYEGIDANLDRIQSYLATVTNKEHKKGTLADIAKGADVLIGVSAPNVFTKEIIASMADKAIVLHLPIRFRKLLMLTLSKLVLLLQVPAAVTVRIRSTTSLYSRVCSAALLMYALKQSLKK